MRICSMRKSSCTTLTHLSPPTPPLILGTPGHTHTLTTVSLDWANAIVASTEKCYFAPPVEKKKWTTTTTTTMTRVLAGPLVFYCCCCCWSSDWIAGHWPWDKNYGLHCCRRWHKYVFFFWNKPPLSHPLPPHHHHPRPPLPPRRH